MEEKEEKIVTQSPMSEKEFNAKIHQVVEHNRKQLLEDFNNGILHFKSMGSVSKFKSVRRAIKRGHMSMFGELYPKRPFNNRKRNKKGDTTYSKRRVYEQLTHKPTKVC